MIAVDTNVVVRLITADDPRQSLQVAKLFGSGEIFLSKTVLLETEWVLRRLYRFDRPTIVRALRNLIDSSNARCEDETRVRRALAWAADGMDVADAMHLASSPRAERFATFDRALIRSSRKAGTLPLASEP
ncbi:MAG: type II toxin-antitoxin system VapC family toxin [Proteobacteria bacterium]|nr:type II toxin-antitoxin system VapC family toxin [Pseudomonadota bacterium]